MVTLEVVLYTLNEAICVNFFQTVDTGGAMYVHVFGAYFGLAASYFFKPSRAIQDPEERTRASYNSTMMALLGAVFLFVYWPSFNGALASPSQHQRVFVNTVMALCASCITACGISRLVYQRLTTKVVFNATLAGGVAIGSASSLVVSAYIAMCIGAAAGFVAVLGELKLARVFQERLKLHDTRGVNNLHGLPGILGGLAGSLATTLSAQTFNEDGIDQIFAAVDDGRTVQQQGLYQALALAVSLGMAIVGGLVVGFLVQNCCPVDNQFDDEEHFQEVFYDIPMEDIPLKEKEMKVMNQE